MRKKILLGIIFIFSCVGGIIAQGLKVVEVKETATGSDAFHAPLDNAGYPCGLVKVLSTYPDLKFEGNIVGDVGFENNEYKVFLAKGTNKFKVKRPQILPITVNLPDYGIDEVTSKATYIMKVKDVALKAKKCLLTMDVKPREAKVFIDDVLVDNETNDGGYRILLPKGEHVCKVEERGYRSQVAVVKTGKGAQSISIELESLLADVEVNSQTSGVHIYIDGKDMGIGSWRGKLPAGKYDVEAKLDGYLPIKKTIELVEKDHQILNLPQMERAKVNLSVLTNISEAVVYLDGIEVRNPKDIPDVQIGKHNIKVKAPFGYNEVAKDITLSMGQDNTVNIYLEPLNDLYAKAFSGDTDSQAEICHQKIESAKYNPNDSIERNFWYDKIYENFDKIKDSSLNKILFTVEGEELGGIYNYFKRDHEKALILLHKWNNTGHYGFYDYYWHYYYYTEVAWHYYYLGKYVDAITWGTKAIAYSCWDIAYYFTDVTKEACSKLNDLDKGVSIMVNTMNNKWEVGAKIVLFEGIGDLYKESNKCTKALPYYRKCLQLLQGSLDIDGIYDVDGDKESIIEKIKECNPGLINKVSNGTYRLNGAIKHKQNYYINMEIHVNNSQVTGQYIVTNGENVYVALSGTIDAFGNMKLYEYKNGEPTGYYFTGNFEQATFTGTYRSTSSTLTMNFSVSAY